MPTTDSSSDDAKNGDSAKDDQTGMRLAAERERRRIADELHDTTVQQLVLAQMLLGLAIEKGLLERLDEVRVLLEDSLEQLRALTMELAPGALQSAGVCAAIEWLSEQLGRRWRLHIRCSLDRAANTLPDAISETLFQGARELMTNVARHARANVCDVAIRLSDEVVELSVEDDGIGIDARCAAGRRPGLDGGFGLFSLRSRAGELGGELSLDRREGGGTRACLRLPLATSQAPGPG